MFRKGVEWALKYETKLEPADVALIKKALVRCAERTDAVAAGKPAWPDRKGKVVRGYVSAVDGSVQPFGLVVTGGVGTTTFNDQKRQTINLGLGMRVLFTDRAAITVDLRDHIFSLDLLGKRQSTQNVELTAGFSFFF